MRMISIDFDVNKTIELERRSFDEDENTVLRRLLDLPALPEYSAGRSASSASLDHSSKRSPPQIPLQTRSWRGPHGIELQHGTEVSMTYERGAQEYYGKIEDGWWVIDGKRYKTPSGAASGCALKPDGSHPVLGGYKYWKVKPPGEKTWTPLDVFRSTSRP